MVQGTIYVSLTKGKQSNVNVTFGKETLALGPSAHIELAVNDKQPRLDVLDGTVEAVNGATTTTVGKKKALLFDPANSAPPTLLSKNEKGPYDEWDKHSVEYHQRLAPSGGNYASVPYSYGLADMNYYGGFTNMGGCGMMWQPYLASANWSPFNNGTWAWYPGGGYSWVSPYPWGWTAFHSGSWNYCPSSGWGWQPGSQWNGIGNTPLVKSPARSIAPSVHQSRPHPLGPTIVAVNQKPLVASRLNERDSFVFRRDSAGLGVPRGTFGKLNHISSGVVQHGSVERPAYVTSMATGRPLGNETGWPRITVATALPPPTPCRLAATRPPGRGRLVLAALVRGQAAGTPWAHRPAARSAGVAVTWVAGHPEDPPARAATTSVTHRRSLHWVSREGPFNASAQLQSHLSTTRRDDRDAPQGTRRGRR